MEGFCQGWGELDQLADVASEILNAKYPFIGSVRVSKSEKVDFSQLVLVNLLLNVGMTVQLLKLV